MMASIMVLILRGALQLLPIFFGKSAKREEYERLVKESIKVWEQQAGRSAKVRNDHQQVSDELDEKWREKWGDGSTKSEK